MYMYLVPKKIHVYMHFFAYIQVQRESETRVLMYLSLNNANSFEMQNINMRL